MRSKKSSSPIVRDGEMTLLMGPKEGRQGAEYARTSRNARMVEGRLPGVEEGEALSLKSTPARNKG